MSQMIANTTMIAMEKERARYNTAPPMVQRDIAMGFVVIIAHLHVGSQSQVLAHLILNVYTQERAIRVPIRAKGTRNAVQARNVV